jgi:hypothetical protein
VAIEHALNVLSWHENLQKEEIPPEHLWEDSEGLEQWWKRVEDMRSDGRHDMASTDRSSTSSDGDDDEHRDPGMAENDLARFLKAG